MLSRLLSAAALAALLGCPLTAHAQSHKWDGITAEEVTAYVDRMFSEENPGFLVPRDGKVYKFIEPLNIMFRLPECAELAGAQAQTFKDETGLDINFLGSDPVNQKVSLAIFGLKNAEDYKEIETKYPFPFTLLHNKDADYEQMLSELMSTGYIYRNKIFRVNGEILFGMLMFNKNIMIYHCDAVNVFIFSSLTNSTIHHGRRDIDALDMLFFSALYDKSIAIDESESSARFKIVQIMLNKMKGTENGQ